MFSSMLRSNCVLWRCQRPLGSFARASILQSLSLNQVLYRDFATKVQAVNLKKGDLITRKGRLCEVVKAQHVSQGQRPAYIQAELLDVSKGARFAERFRVEEKVDAVDVDNVKFSFSSKSEDGKTFSFTHTQTGESIELSEELLGTNRVPYLQEDMVINVRMIDEKPVSVNFPHTAEVEVAEASDHQNASGGMKPAKLTNGRTVKVPLFVQTGDRLEIKIEDETYVTRV